ncbi:cupin-like domain-containing protein [Roseateles paludis]|uniref:Cupin-like domain-containing protein n=1 Tax=Roseateles paludis TaxID=3145238 RepID=A0ABV0FZR2_9BURK
MKPIAEAPASAAHACLTQQQPVVLRGLAADWPCVKAASQGLDNCLRFWLEEANDEPVDAVLGHPREGRQFGFTLDATGFNFLHDRKPIAALLEQLWRYAQFPDPPALALQSAEIRRCMPGFEARHPMPWVPPGTAPRLWLSNRATVPAHFDASYNLAIVVAGRRRFTLFPPQAVPDLYFGPLEHAPTQAPTSMANVQAPDFERHPRLHAALAVATQAELAPGDAIYMPPLWVHSVESLDPVNGLVNCWWRPETAPGAGPDNPAAALWLATLALRRLPPEELANWRAVFEHFVFDAGADWSHIPAERRGMLGDLDAEAVRALRARIRGMVGE